MDVTEAAGLSPGVGPGSGVLRRRQRRRSRPSGDLLRGGAPLPEPRRRDVRRMRRGLGPGAGWLARERGRSRTMTPTVSTICSSPATSTSIRSGPPSPEALPTASSWGSPSCAGPRVFPRRGASSIETAATSRSKTSAKSAGVGIVPAYGLGAVWSDLDDDGDVDLYVANDQSPTQPLSERRKRAASRTRRSRTASRSTRTGEPGGNGSRRRRLRQRRPLRPPRHELLPRLQHPLSELRRRVLSRRELRRRHRRAELSLPGLGDRVPGLRSRRVSRHLRRERARLSRSGERRNRKRLRPEEPPLSKPRRRPVRGGSASGPVWKSLSREGEWRSPIFDDDGDIDVFVDPHERKAAALPERHRDFRDTGSGSASWAAGARATLWERRSRSGAAGCGKSAKSEAAASYLSQSDSQSVLRPRLPRREPIASRSAGRRERSRRSPSPEIDRYLLVVEGSDF